MATEISPNRLVPIVTDVAFGIVLLVSIVIMLLTEGYLRWSGGFVAGVCVSYGIHVASHMAEFSVNIETSDVTTEDIGHQTE